MGGRIVLAGKKELFLHDWKIRSGKIPSKVILPLNDCGGAEVVPCVGVGDRVCVGQKIAEPVDCEGVFVHASIAGEVTRIGLLPHPVFGKAPAVEITALKTETVLPEIGGHREGWQHLSAEELTGIFRDCGLTEMTPAPVPLHAKIMKRSGEKNGRIIINACESEPYVASAYALIMSHPMEFLKGIEILRRAWGAENALIVTEDDKLEAADLLKSKIYFLKWPNYRVEVVRSAYPQDMEAPMLEALGLKPAQRSGKAQGAADAIHDAATAYAVYEAVVLQKPLYERVVTVGGECLFEPKNLRLRLGMSLAEALANCRGLLREPGRLLMGGPMRGVETPDREVPVIKGTQAVLALPAETVLRGSEEACIRCGRCLESCPVDLSPAMMTLAAERGLLENAKQYGLTACIECGNCAYVCPSKRPMLRRIREARASVSIPGIPTRKGHRPGKNPFRKGAVLTSIGN